MQKNNDIQQKEYVIREEIGLILGTSRSFRRNCNLKNYRKDFLFFSVTHFIFGGKYADYI